MLLKQRAAMFGLDARVALAIFGGLSIITGAALFSAIGQTRATAILTEIEELHKSAEQILLDTGRQLPPITPPCNHCFLDITSLRNDSGASGWQGPYIKDEVLAGINSFVRHSWAWSMIKASDVAASCAVTPCYNWVQIFGFPEDVFIKIDEMVDGGNGATSGRVRYNTPGAPTPNSILVMGSPRLKE